MCLKNDIPKAPPPPPPPPEEAMFQPGAEEDVDSLDIDGGAKNGKKALTTDRANTGLNIPTGV